MDIQIVSATHNDKAAWWEVIKLIDGEFNLHTIPDEAFKQWARQMGTEDPQRVLDAVLYAPFITSTDLEEVNRVKTAHAPKAKRHTGELRNLAHEKGLAQRYFPTEEDPLQVLLAAAKEGIDNGQVQQVLGSTPDGTGSSDPRLGSGGERRHLDAGVAGSSRPLPAGNRRRVVAGEQTHHG